MGLIRETQLDFSAGEQNNVAPHLIDERGVYWLLNTMLADDGSGFKRGGSQAFATAAFGSALRYVWDGFLAPGRRTFLASTTAFGALNLTKEPFSLGGAGYPSIPKIAHEIRGMLFIGGGKIYGGSLKAADYSTGKVKKAEKGSKIVTGNGTAWEANVDPGMLLRIGPTDRIYVVAAVKGNEELELTEAYGTETVAEQEYTLKRLETASTPYLESDLYFVAGRRLIVCDRNVVRMSVVDQPHNFTEQIEPGEAKVAPEHLLDGGVRILGGRGVGVDRALIFHTRGITSISNLGATIVDAQGNQQHRIDQYSQDIVLWGNAGIAAYKDALVVPALDNVWLLDGKSEPVPVGTSIVTRYRELVAEGATPGVGWVANEHYFLPILNGSGVPQETLCCRLDRPFKSRGQTYWPWSHLTGAGAALAAGTRHEPIGPGESQAILGAANDGRLVDISKFFTPDVSVKNDHDGTPPPWGLLTRDVGGGDLGIHRWRRFVLIYELEAPPESEPLISCEVGIGTRQPGLPLWGEELWEEFLWAGADTSEFELLEGYAPPNVGSETVHTQNAWEWLMNERARYTRYRLQCADAVAKLTVRGIEIFPAEIGGVRQTKVA